MIEFYLVDVKNISSDIPRSNFGESDLENLADIILESGGIIKPLILKAIGVETYTVIDGHFEYYAAVRAREKEPRKGEMVNAFVISPKSESVVVKQIEALKELKPAIEQVKLPSEPTNLESWITNIELRLEKQINEYKVEKNQERQSLEDKLKEIDSKQINTQDKLENLINKITEVAESVKRIDLFTLDSKTNQHESQNITGETIDYHSLTKEQLKKVAKEKEIKVTTKMTKSEIINALITAASKN